MLTNLTKEIREKLSSPIPTDEIEFKPQVTRGDKALMVAYVDARWVAERLDESANGDWSFEWENLGLLGDRIAIKGILTVCGVTREDVGEHEMNSSGIDPYKSAVSDALKRAAVLFGVGRELYRMESEWVGWDEQKRRVKDGEVERLRAKLKQKPVHWTQDEARVEKFYAWCFGKTLTNAQANDILKIAKITDYKGTAQEAAAAIEAFIGAR